MGLEELLQGAVAVGGILQEAGGGVGELPGRRVAKTAGEQFVHEACHRLTPTLRLMVQRPHDPPADAGRVVGSPGHVG